MNAVKVCTKYCIGCGLCQSELNLEMKENEKGYAYAVCTSSAEEFLNAVCPVLDSHKSANEFSSIWGEIDMAAGAYATDETIRKKASSGGILTALALYLLETKQVDGILQVQADKEYPTRTICQVSTTKEQVLKSCGSRYTISSPWKELSSEIEEGKRYAAVGKPCDILALRKCKNRDKKYDNILYLFSFFCAGLPSMHAQKKLLSEMGINEQECSSLTYRGNGWPGYTTAISKNGEKYTMEYSKAWGGILGRDVHPYCRVCIDGIGEAADISCGDGWYIKNGEPDFTERDGRNIVFTRNTVGTKLLKDAAKAGYLIYEKWDDLKDLEIIQKHQYTRKTTMRAKLMGYRLFGKVVPPFDRKLLKKYSKEACFQQKLKVFLGTVKRIIQGKI